MASTTKLAESATLMPSSLTLARWQMRQTWHLLAMTAIGMVALALLACMAPLYSRVMFDAGLHTILTATPDSSLITLHSPSLQVVPDSSTQQSTLAYTREIRQNLGYYLQQPVQPQFVIQTTPYALRNSPSQGASQIILQGYDIAQATPHLRLLQGHLPARQDATQQAANASLDIAITSETASDLHLTVGSSTEIELTAPPGASATTTHLTLRVAGLFQPVSDSDPYWHGDAFQPIQSNATSGKQTFQALAASNDLIGAVSERFRTLSPNLHDATLLWSAAWYYPLDLSRIDSAHLPSLLSSLDHASAQMPIASGLTDQLKHYQMRSQFMQVPVLVLLALAGGIVLLFIAMIVDLLVEFRTGAIAVLLSRGASRRQIFGAFVAQSIGMGLIVLIIGPLAAIPLTRLLAQATNQGAAPATLSMLAGNPFPLALSVIGYAAIAVLAAIIVSSFAIYRATALDVVALRRETTRSTRCPFWQRLYLDLFAALLALSGYSFSLYELHTGLLPWRSRTLLLAPLSLLMACCGLLAAVLLFLRVLPWLLDRAAHLATRWRGAAPLLALAQVSRTPRQVMRMTLLLTLTTAFATFTLLFTASQAQRAQDIAAYFAGADFSGSIVEAPDRYRTMPGVIAASTGYLTTATAADGSNITVKAVDTGSFAQAAIWSAQDSTQTLPDLLNLLNAQRARAIREHSVPAIVDAATWQALGLSPGAHFTLIDPSGSAFHRVALSFVAIASVHYIPTLSSDFDNSLMNNENILVDYETYAATYARAAKQPGLRLAPNYFWLRTRDDAASLAATRAALNKTSAQSGSLFYDRRALLNALHHDPLYRALGGVLSLGTIISLLLALAGSLLATWLHVRSRLTNFAILRALGTAPRQVAGMLAWEHSLIYLLMLALGTLAGLLLSLMTLPSLVLTSITADSIMAVSHLLATPPDLPPVRLIVPPELGSALGLLLLICVIALGTMISIVSRPALSQSLRLNED